MEYRIFVRNLPFSVKSHDLKDYFESCGEITNARVITDKQTGRSRGFGFVTFNSEEQLEKALKLQGNDFNGREVQIEKAQPREQAPRAEKAAAPTAQL